MLSIAILAATLTAAIAAPQEFASQLKTRTLSDHELAVPRDLPARPVVMVVGFTRASRSQTAEWTPKINHDPILSKELTTYQVMVLEDIPSLFRGFIIGSIRSDVPKPMHEVFLVVTQNSEAWKAAVSFGAEDDAYVLLLAPDHRIIWRAEGPPTDAALSALHEHVNKLLVH